MMIKEHMPYTELEVWKSCRELVKEIYIITKLYPQEETYGLIQQIRRCAVSVPSNIAEGVGRNHTKDTLQFLYISRGSLYELETQLFISLDLTYISAEVFNKINSLIIDSRKMLNGLIKYYTSKIKN